jgi:hypothetical protein
MTTLKIHEICVWMVAFLKEESLKTNNYAVELKILILLTIKGDQM